MSYSVRVKALSLDGRFGNFSEAVYVSGVDQGIHSAPPTNYQHPLRDC